MNIQKKIAIGIAALFILATLACVSGASWFFRRTMMQQYEERSELLLYAMKAVRAHMGDVIRPKASAFISVDDFITELQSTSFTARGTFLRIDEARRHGFQFKIASTKPRNPANAATELETGIIADLDAKLAAGEDPVWRGVRNIDGTDYFLIAAGEENMPSCERCHSTPDVAPRGLKERYPVEHDRSYGRITGRIESAEIVAAPISSLDNNIKTINAVIVSFAGAGLILVLVLVAMGLRLAFRPIVKITEVAGTIADGDLRAAGETLDRDRDGEAASRAGKKPGKADVTALLTAAFRKMTSSLSSLLGEVGQAGVQVSASASQIAASARQVEATVAEQAASTAEVGDAGRKIAAVSSEIAASMEEVGGAVRDAAARAGESKRGLAAMEDSMRRLVEATEFIAEKLAVISDKAENIGTVVATINKISDQTNLLSLNAAIEAEKAGEYGRGFSVVAREIRRLADKTAAGALDIERMVAEMRSAVSSEVMEMDRFSEEVRRGVGEVAQVGSGLGEIVDLVRELEPQFDAVMGGVRGQADDAGRISQAMEHLGEAANQTRDSVREFKRAADQLNEAVHGLQDEVAFFKVGK